MCSLWGLTIFLLWMNGTKETRTADRKTSFIIDHVLLKELELVKWTFWLHKYRISSAVCYNTTGP